MKIYGTPEPPEYDLSKVRTSIHLLYGTNDWLSPSEVSFFFGKIKNIILR